MYQVSIVRKAFWSGSLNQRVNGTETGHLRPGPIMHFNYSIYKIEFAKGPGTSYQVSNSKDFRTAEEEF